MTFSLHSGNADMSETDTKIDLKNDVCLELNPQSAVAVTAASGAQTNASVNEEQTNSTDPENVTAVVTKAKRAATFLWTLLHAQVRTCNFVTSYR